MKGDEALQGSKEYIEGHHEFTITNQTSFIANGMLIFIFPDQERKARWSGKDTGSEGQSVARGEKVRVYNVDIEFKYD
jgi:hypothetical protein